MKRTVPVTISGFSYSSPIFFQNATSAKMDWYFSRSFSRADLGFGAAARRGCGAGAGCGRHGARRATPSARPSATFRGRTGAVSPSADGRAGGRGLPSPCRPPSRQRQDVRFDHPQTGLRAQLASQETNGFEVGIDVFGAAADEARDEHAAERRHVHLRRRWASRWAPRRNWCTRSPRRAARG